MLQPAMELFSRNSGKHKKQFRVLMFPWLAHGHISPFIELSKRLADEGINISFLSMPVNIFKIRPSFANQNYTGKVQLLELALPSVEGLPAGVENTTDLPYDQIPLLLKAMDGLEEPFERLLQQISPDCLVYDCLQYWTTRAAAKLGIASVFFVTFSAASFIYDFCPARGKSEEISAEDFTRPPPNYPSSAISWRLWEAHSRVCFCRNKVAGISGRDRFMKCYDGCSAIVIRSCHEIEGEFIRYFQSMTGKRVFPVGPLLPDGLSIKQSVLHKNLLELESSHCLRWLDNQAPSSVVFVAFGSECFLSKEQIRELALGLEASQQPFIWALRFPCYSDKPDNPEVHYDQQSQVSASLPEGFEDRITKRGIVVGGWVPQKEILSHPSTGGFVSHCGWSSILEAMSLGVPLIALPMQSDQGLNARLAVEELKVGVEVGRGTDGSLSREEICKAVRMLMVGEKGRRVRLKAEEMGALFRSSILNDGSQKTYTEDFSKYLYGLRITFGS